MKTGMKKRITAILLCIAMVVTTFGTNGSVVMAADSSEPISENDTEMAAAEIVNETEPAEVAVQTETAVIQTEPETVQTEAETTLLETETIQTEETESETVTETVEETQMASESETETQSETVTESEKNIQNNFQFEDAGIFVNVELKDTDAVPNGAQLIVSQIQNRELTTNSTDVEKAEKASYDNINTVLQEKALKEETPIDGFFAYHIAFVKDGEEIEVQSEDMKVSVNFKQAVLPEVFQNADSNLKAKQASLFHFVPSMTEAGKTDAADMKENNLSIGYAQIAGDAETEKAVESIEFTTDSLNNYAIAWNGEDTTTEFTYEDEQVTVKAVLSEAGILPRGAVLKAEPVEDKAKLKEVKTQLEEQAGEDESIDGFLAYDIRFEKDGQEIEPNGQVNVSMNFKEAVKPEMKVQTEKAEDETTEEKTEDVALYHFKEIGDKVNVEKIDDAKLGQNSDTQVSAAEFTVDSFSIFALTWINTGGLADPFNGTFKINIHLVDKQGNELVGKDLMLTKETNDNIPGSTPELISEWLITGNTEAKEALKGKKFVRSYLKSTGFTGEKEVIKISIMKKSYLANYTGLQATFFKGAVKDILVSDQLYFEYEQLEPLEVVNTVDSASKGIVMNMFDYETKQFIGADWAEGEVGNGIKQGMVYSKLDKDGYPVFTEKYAMERENGESLTNISLKEWFDPSGKYITQTNANNLFLESVYNDSKYFYYNSFENFARLIQNDNKLTGETVGNFRVYKQLGTPSSNDIPIYKHGHFMPYNDIDSTKISANKNIYNEYGQMMNETDPRYGENLYDTQGNNFCFGMSMEAEFTQPNKGLINKEPMLFEFNGDDDMWVFIDGVLVLDIGGGHGARSGSINFVNGEVKVQGAADTDIKTLFKNAGEDTSQFIEETNTFKDYTHHKIKVFYMERGGGASNLKLKFNLSTVPKGSVNVTKNITNINEGAYSDVNFNFKMYIEDEKGTVTRKEDSLTKYSLVNQEEFNLIDADGNISKKTKTGSDGTFTLKHGQTAQFLNFEAGKKYFVDETGVVQNEYDKFAVNGSFLTTENGDIIESDNEDGTLIIRSKPLTVGTDLTVSFQNTCSGTNLKDLVIKKQLAGGQSSSDTYEITVRIGGQLFKGGFYRNGASVEGSMETTSDGKITLKANESIRIPNIPSGTSFEVKETNLEDLNKDYIKYDKEKYTVVNADSPNTVDKAAGILIYGQNTQVTVTNTILLGNLTIEKQIDEVNYNNGDPIFTFQIDRKDNSGNIVETMYRTIRFTKDENVTSKKVVLKNVEFGNYVVTELKTMRYECSKSEVQETILTKEVPNAAVQYLNVLTNGDNFSHTDMVVNHFEVVNGEIVITPNKQTDANSN